MDHQLSPQRIPPEIFDQARALAAAERRRVFAALFARLGCLLRGEVHRRHGETFYRFQRSGLWRGI